MSSQNDRFFVAVPAAKSANSPAGRQREGLRTIGKPCDLNWSKSAENNLFSALSGTHGRIRTSGLPLRRRPLYPAELRGRICNIQVSAASCPIRRTTGCAIRGRPLYPAELGGHTVSLNSLLHDAAKCQSKREKSLEKSVEPSYTYQVVKF